MINQKKLVWSLVAVAIGMFGFAFALVPLYNVFCSVTGLNGKIDIKQSQNDTTGRYKIPVDKVDEEARFVTVEFDSTRNEHLPCEFSPRQPIVQVKVGELFHTAYYVKNLTDRKILIQAIPSISPGRAAKHLKKLECFCFTQQVLEPFQALELPLRFWLEPELPASVYRLTLSYTLFDVTSKTSIKEQSRVPQTR